MLLKQIHYKWMSITKTHSVSLDTHRVQSECLLPKSTSFYRWVDSKKLPGWTNTEAVITNVPVTVWNLTRQFMRGSKGGCRHGSGPPLPLKNLENIGFLSNTGPDPLNITKLPSQLSMLAGSTIWLCYLMLGNNLHASETSFHHRLASETSFQ